VSNVSVAPREIRANVFIASQYTYGLVYVIFFNASVSLTTNIHGNGRAGFIFSQHQLYVSASAWLFVEIVLVKPQAGYGYSGLFSLYFARHNSFDLFGGFDVPLSTLPLCKIKKTNANQA